MNNLRTSPPKSAKFLQKPFPPYFFHGAFAPSFIWRIRPCPLVKTAVRCSLLSGVVRMPYSVRLSQRNRTVVVSIHQPRYAIFRLFDRLTLLAAGNVIYHGKATEALDFFQTLGIFKSYFLYIYALLVHPAH